MPRRGENIYKRSDGRWEARYMVGHKDNGRGIYRSVYADSYREVKEKRDAAVKEFEAGKELAQAATGTVAAVSESWIRDSAHTWKESTKYRYLDKLRIYILPEFGDRELSTISTEEIERYLAHLQTEGQPGKEPLSASTLGLILTVLKQIAKYAQKTGMQLRFSPDSISVKRGKGSISVFSEKEERVLVGHLKQDMDGTGIGVITCLFTGLRIGEICALNCDEINLEERILHVRKTMQRLPDEGGIGKTAVKIDTPKTEASIRDIPFTSELAELIRPFYKPGAYLLSGESRKFVEPRTMEDRFARILKKCGLADVNFHTTRHTFATRCIERGMDAKTLSELLGHASVSTTLDRYVHLSMSHKAESMRKIADLL